MSTHARQFLNTASAPDWLRTEPPPPLPVDSRRSQRPRIERVGRHSLPGALASSKRTRSNIRLAPRAPGARRAAAGPFLGDRPCVVGRTRVGQGMTGALVQPL